MTRTELQEIVIKTVIPVLETEKRASIKVGTGVGKGKIMLEILDHFKPEKITWLIDSQDGRDVNDSSEFYKWGYEHLLPFVEFACYQTAYKWKNKDLGFLICNEADYMATEAYSKAVSENTYSHIFMATATISESKQWFFDEYAPVVYTLTTQEAEDLKIVNKTIYKFVDFDLSTEKNIKLTGKFGDYFQSEQDQYIYWDNQFISTTIALENMRKECDNHYKGIKSIPGFSYESFKTKRAALYKKLQYLGSKRASVLYNSETSIEVAKKVIAHILKEPNNKVVCVSKLTNQIDKICNYTWHSKNAGTKKEPNNVKDMLNSGEINCAGVCGKINRGANLVNVNHFVNETFDGSDTVGSQINGRGKRLDVEKDEVCTVWFLISYFTKNGKRLPTRSYSFANKRLVDFNLNSSNTENININEL